MPRGKGGVGVALNSNLAGKVTKLEDGNERILPILIKTQPSTCICLICVYLPTNNSSTHSYIEFGECLDILDNIINKYSRDYTIVLAGDLNATLLEPRTGNKHDTLLQQFVTDQNLHCPKYDARTFFQHSGLGSSQIDYILSDQPDMVTKYKIHDRYSTNLSSHTIVSAVLKIDGETKQNTCSRSGAIWKYQWNKMDMPKFQLSLANQLKEFQCDNIKMEMSESNLIEVIMNTLQQATLSSTPKKIIKLKGPKWKASPTAKILIETCHQAHKKWIDNGKPDGILRNIKISTQRNLRRQFRQEHSQDRQNLYKAIMENPSTELFHRLIRRNRGSSNVHTSCITTDNTDIYNPNDQRRCFLKYFEDLAIPKDKGYDKEYLDLCTVRKQLINKTILQSDCQTETITCDEVKNAITQLHTGKAADEFGISAEQLKAAGDILIPFITAIFNRILQRGSFPDMLKSGVLTPVLKKSKNPALLDNYRGITVTPIFTKVFEYVLLPKLDPYFKQSPMQFGFTTGVPILLAALLVSEAKAETQLQSLAPLLMVTIDSQKAFDVVSHVILLDKLYEADIHPKLWKVIDNMYTGMSSKVKWSNGISDTFTIQQGVRQGGILSPLLYKIYNNNLLQELHNSRLGFSIGNTYIGCPTCADDIALLSSNPIELQCMLSTVQRHSRNDRVTIHPTKTKAVAFCKSKVYKSSLSWKLGDSDISPVNQTLHLGILRSEINENGINIADRISVARRTLYALINTGLHGSNGVNPIVAYKIYKSYVLPKLLYGLEILPLKQTHMMLLRKFHIETLRRFQSLPTRTACCIVYLLLGALPIEAEIHRRHLSLLYNIISSENPTIQELLHRQKIVHMDNPVSYFGRVTEILYTYNLPEIAVIILQCPTKLEFKKQCKVAIEKTWTENLKSESLDKSSLKYIVMDSLEIGTPHMCWNSLKSTISDVKKGITKARMLTGTFITETTRQKFSTFQSDAVCQLCGGGDDEDLHHIILDCPALFSERLKYFGRIKEEVTHIIGIAKYSNLLNNREQILKFILDCSIHRELFDETQIDSITRLTTELCHQLYVRRLKLENEKLIQDRK